MATKKKTTEAPQGVGFEISNIAVSEIHPSTDNPRSNISNDSVSELAESIKQHGILQPVIIRADKDFGTEQSPWEMVCGHRRLLACQLLGIETIPAIIRELSDDEAFDMMITENLQRKDIEPLDEAEAYRALMEHDGANADELAARFGKSVKYIKGRIALNELVPELKECLKAGSLTIGAGISLAALPMDQQLQFHKEYHPLTSEADESVISPMSIDDVKDFIEETSDRISDQSFAEAADESWITGQLHKCAGCPFNSATQGALFVDMVAPGHCSNESCLNEKAMAYARHIFNYWLPNFKPATSHLEPGDVVLYIDKNTWFRGSAQEQKKELYDTLCHTVDELGSIDFRNLGGKIWNTEPDNPELKEAIRVLDLRSLVAGYAGYMMYYRLPKQSNDPLAPQGVTHNDVHRKLGALRDKEQAEIYEILEPMSKTAIETWFGSDASSVNCQLPPFLATFIAYHLIDSMSWIVRSELLGGSDTSLQAIKRFMAGHTLNDVLKAALLDRITNGQQYYRTHLLSMVMEACAADATAEAVKEIRDKYQPKIDKLIQQLHDMGYDEFNKPLPDEGEPESETNEQES